MVARLEQRLEAGEERINEICDVAVAVGRLLQIGDDQHRAHCNCVDRPILWYETRIIRRGKARRDIAESDRGAGRQG